MPASKKTGRRGSSAQLIEHLLKERGQLLALLLRLFSDVKAEKLDTQDKDLLEEFCQVLVDYIAAGHFGLYERISGGKERRLELAGLAKKIYPQIENTTQFALEFTEKYNAENRTGKSGNLAGELSRLGEALTVRIELEDKLIAKMLA